MHNLFGAFHVSLKAYSHIWKANANAMSLHDHTTLSVEYRIRKSLSYWTAMNNPS